jgi:mono/diheme cytochrome c family protein
MWQRRRPQKKHGFGWEAGNPLSAPRARTKLGEEQSCFCFSSPGVHRAVGPPSAANSQGTRMQFRFSLPFQNGFRFAGPILAFASLAALLWPIYASPAEKQPIPADHAEKLAKGQEVFAQHVRQVLIDQCVKCHGGAKTKADFDLTTREGMLHGGNSKKPGVIPFKAKESRLFLLVTQQEKPHMPSQAEKLSSEQLAYIEKWIDLGAPYDKPLVDKPKTAVKKPLVVTDEDRKFWSFLPLQHAEPPKVKNEAWCKTPIDRFILAKLEENGVTPNAAVDRRKLIRRVYFDLIGLPPTPEQVEAFVNNSAADAYEKLLDHLLDNPH